MEAGMPQQDQHGFSEISTNLQYLRAIKQLLLDDIGLSKLAFKSDCGWSPKSLAYAAILWAWADPNTLRDRYTARSIHHREQDRMPVVSACTSHLQLSEFREADCAPHGSSRRTHRRLLAAPHAMRTEIQNADRRSRCTRGRWYESSASKIAFQ